MSNKEVFDTCSTAVLEGIRKQFGPPVPGDNMTARIAVALMQLSLRYFSETGANKEVVRHFFDELMDGPEEGKKAELERDSNRLWLPGQKRRV